MSDNKDKGLASNVLCHAWNKDGTQIAICPNNNEIWIYETKGKHEYQHWEKKHVLTEHVGLVCSIDWDHVSNQIATCGHDRNAYVWRFDGHTWQPTLVILRISRAATSIRWSPQGNKFAVTSGMKCVPICNFDPQSNWWVSKIIKKHKSTVLSVAWCPNNKFVVTGSSDFRCRIFSAFVKEVDSAEDDGFGAVWPDQHRFGEVLAEFDQAKAWVHSVAWSPNAFRVAFVGHGSTVHFAQILAGSPPSVQTVAHRALPFRDIKFLSNDALVGVGYDNNPTIFRNTGGDSEPKWAYYEVLDKGEGDKKDKGPEKSAFAASRAVFHQQTHLGIQAGDKKEDTTLPTRHQNTITSVCVLKPTLLTTTGLDGRVFFWDLTHAGLDLSSLHLS